MPTQAQFYRWSDIPAERLNPLLTRKFVNGKQGTISHIQLKKGCIVPTHSHPNEQFASVVTGSLRFTLDPEGAAEQVTLGPGEMLLIPGNLPHSAEALEDTFNLDIFAPAREDWASGADAYLR
jgi:quercetin dioxygenase-like cupin family protein